MLTNWKKKFEVFVKILGPKAIAWLLLGVFSGCLLSVVELLLAAFLQFFLKSLGAGFTFGNESSLFSYFEKENFSIFTLMFFLGCIGVVRGFAMFTDKYASALTQEIVGVRLRLFALHELLISDKNQYVSASLINTRFGEIFPKTVQFFYHVAQSIPQLVQVFVLLVTLFFVSVPSTLIALCGLLIIASILFFIHRQLRIAANEIPREQEALLGGIERVTRNWILIRAFRTNKTEFSKLAKNIMKYSLHSERSFFYSALGSILPQTFGVLLLICIIVSSLSLNIISSGKLISFLYLFLRLTQTLSVLFSYLSTVVMFSPQTKITAAYLENFKKSEIQSLATLHKDSKEFNQEEDGRSIENKTSSLQAIEPPSIKLEKVFFRYEKTTPYLIDNFNLYIAPGEQVAFIGRSGSGKSTLLALVLGLLKPEKGKVQFGDMSAAEFFSKFSERIGYVGPEPFLIDGTIKQNLDYGSTSINSNIEYENVLKETALLSVVQNLSNGIHHRILGNGEGLSSGQKQRLSIARSLLRKPIVLILDEVTSNLDVDTEQEVVKTIASIKGKSTVLMVSHRMGALSYADKVIDLSKIS